MDKVWTKLDILYEHWCTAIRQQQWFQSLMEFTRLNRSTAAWLLADLRFPTKSLNNLHLASTTADHISARPTLYLILSIPLLIIVICLSTWLITTIQFWRTVSRSKKQAARAPAEVKPVAPPLLPYAIPWLGSAMSFLNEDPGSFWKMLQKKLQDTDAKVPICTILLGGQKAHVVNSATAVQALFKSKQVSRDLFNHQLATQALGASEYDAELMFPPSPALEDVDDHKKRNERTEKMEALNHEFLLSQSAVNSLTNRFMECLHSVLDRADINHEWKTIDLFSWWRKAMFEASTTAVLGSTILQENPDLAEQFWQYEAGLLARFYGLPRLVKPDAYSCMDVMLNRTQEWLQRGLTQHHMMPPEEPDWEPHFGSKVVRARHRLYQEFGLKPRGRAAFDLGFLFALQANAIPSTCWLLAHLLSPVTPHDVLDRIQEQFKHAQTPTGDIDVSRLASQPLLNSALHETLRLYVDSLVTRQLQKDMVVDGYLLKKGDLIMAPSSLSQHDPTFWEQGDAPSADNWYAERFLRRDDETGKEYFSTSWASGKFFPFGGGSHVCPGRVFAKQEMLGALATLFQRFDLKFIEYVDTNRSGNRADLGKAASGFPKVKRQYAGNGTLKMDGDIRVQIRRK
ncbi:Cytochrome P450 monooxygenase efuG [Exophiala dermatitidis]